MQQIYSCQAEETLAADTRLMFDRVVLFTIGNHVLIGSTQIGNCVEW